MKYPFKMFLLLCIGAAALFAIAAASFADEFQITRATVFTVARAPEPVKPPEVTEHGHDDGKSGRRSYDDAHNLALAEGKPLVLWVGGGDAVCVPCMKRLDEAVHCVLDSFPDTPVQALVVAMPENGRLVRIATITQWITGDSVWGHVPSIRRAIDNWRTKRTTVRSGWSMASSMGSGYGGGMKSGSMSVGAKSSSMRTSRGRSGGC